MSEKFDTSFGSVELKVAPQVMHSTADKINKSVTQLTTRFDSLLDKIKLTISYWEGANAEKTRNCFSDEQDNIKSLLNNVSVYAEKLSTITANYEKTESDATEASAELPSGILN